MKKFEFLNGRKIIGFVLNDDGTCTIFLDDETTIDIEKLGSIQRPTQEIGAPIVEYDDKGRPHVVGYRNSGRNKDE